MDVDDFPPGTRVRVVAHGAGLHVGRMGTVIDRTPSSHPDFPITVEFGSFQRRHEDYLPEELERVDVEQDADLGDLAYGLHAEDEAATYQALLSARDEAYGDQDRDERAVAR